MYLRLMSGGLSVNRSSSSEQLHGHFDPFLAFLVNIVNWLFDTLKYLNGEPCFYLDYCKLPVSMW